MEKNWLTLENSENGIILTKCSEKAEGEIIIPEGVVKIDDRAFAFCENIIAVDLPSSVIEVGVEAFFYCLRLSSVNLPKNLKSIGKAAFARCESLKHLQVEAGNPVYDSRENCNAIIETATNTLLYGSANTIIPQSVKRIGDDAFSWINGLKSIVIPKSVIHVNGSAFSQCHDLMSIQVEEGNPVYDSRSNCNAIIETDTNTLLVGCSITIIPNNVTGIGNAAFEGRKDLVNIHIPESIKSIGKNAFSCCDKITSVIIPNGVTVIEDFTFMGCTSLVSITIPESVVSIGEGSFFDCRKLKNIEFPDNLTSIGDNAFGRCSGLVSIQIPKGVTNIGDEAFDFENRYQNK